MTYEAVGVLGAGAAAGTLAMAAVAHVRPKTSTVTLLCTHRLCHCERKKRKKRKRGVSRTAHKDSQHCQHHRGSAFQQYGSLAFQRWAEGQRWTWRTVNSLTKISTVTFPSLNSSILCPLQSSWKPCPQIQNNLKPLCHLHLIQKQFLQTGTLQFPTLTFQQLVLQFKWRVPVIH